MGTRFYGEGNIGSDPEVRTFPVRENQPPRTLLRLNVRFDNLVPKDGEVVDRGGFWADVEWWHRDAERWSRLYQRGMRVVVVGKMVQDSWEQNGETRTAFKVQADRVAILPHRVGQVIMDAPHSHQQPAEQYASGPGASQEGYGG
ncbi:single-stranded DNA-binding protein [Halomonas sp. Y3]|uniref:single-stranded DNA-binding protein n=1 Tax=Halomonas sp. Y3 TaxID=2956797 RepID=UPI00209D34BE|nr:single-stranded DNA-binding protein [Halomonas sp. Y3]